MMPDTTSFIDATTADGYLLVLVIVLPVLGILLSLALGGKFVERITLALLLVGLCVAIAIFAAVLRSDQLVVYVVGNWQPPLGIALRALCAQRIRPAKRGGCYAIVLCILDLAPGDLERTECSGSGR
jgi:hypothetical protein